MAPTFVAGFVAIVVQVLPLIGIHVGSDALTTTIQTISTIALGLFILYRQVTTGRATVIGARPK